MVDDDTAAEGKNEDALAAAADELSAEVEYHYIKSNHFRVIHADGALGGVTPRGYVHLAFYNERPAIPRKGIRKLSEDGSHLEQEVYVEGFKDIVREIEFDVLIDENAARELHDWLNRQIENLEERARMIEEHGKPE